MDLGTWISIIVGVIGIVVGLMGAQELHVANQRNSNIIADSSITASQFQQAQIIHNGLDDYVVMKLAKDTATDEVIQVISKWQLTSASVQDGVLTLNNPLAERLNLNNCEKDEKDD